MQNWVSFDGNSVQGYLPDQVGFDQSGKQASKTSFMPGSAEEMVANAIDLLEESYAAVSKYVYPDQRSRAVFSGAKAVLCRLTVGQRLATVTHFWRKVTMGSQTSDLNHPGSVRSR